VWLAGSHRWLCSCTGDFWVLLIDGVTLQTVWTRRHCAHWCTVVSSRYCCVHGVAMSQWIFHTQKTEPLVPLWVIGGVRRGIRRKVLRCHAGEKSHCTCGSVRNPLTYVRKHWWHFMFAVLQRCLSSHQQIMSSTCHWLMQMFHPPINHLPINHLSSNHLPTSHLAINHLSISHLSISHLSISHLSITAHHLHTSRYLQFLQPLWRHRQLLQTVDDHQWHQLPYQTPHHVPSFPATRPTSRSTKERPALVWALSAAATPCWFEPLCCMFCDLWLSADGVCAVVLSVWITHHSLFSQLYRITAHNLSTFV